MTRKLRVSLAASELIAALLAEPALAQKPGGVLKIPEDDVQPIIFYGRFATCWQPKVKGLTVMANSLFNGWRFEDVWLNQ